MPTDASEICDKVCDFVKGKTSKKKLYCWKQIIQPEELNIQQIIVKPDIIILNYMRSEASKYLLALTITWNMKTRMRKGENALGSPRRAS